METEIIDKLFLELSQFTYAKTAREIVLLKALKNYMAAHQCLSGANECPTKTAALAAAALFEKEE